METEKNISINLKMFLFKESLFIEQVSADDGDGDDDRKKKKDSFTMKEGIFKQNCTLS